MNNLMLMMKLVKLGNEINKIVTKYMATDSEAAKAILLVEANDLKHKYAKKIITEDFPLDAYDTMFKVQESNKTHKNYIELYVEDIKEFKKGA